MSTTYDKLMAQINKRAADRRASDREIARLSGVSVAELDADTTAPDPRAEDEADAARPETAPQAQGG